MTTVHARKYLVGIVVLLAWCSFARAKTPEVVLTNSECTVTIEPDTLKVGLRTPAGRDTPVSDGQADLGAAHDLRSTNEEVSWTLREGDLSIAMGLHGQDLTVEIHSKREGAFTWPVLDLSPPIRALIWPFWEGRYVPLDDSQWRLFLTVQEWDTLEGLCMPFWGLYSGDFTLTYIATNRYNNQIAFENTGERLGARFTHEFPASRPEWVYGFIIRLSESASPVEPARQYRRWLLDRGEFVTMREKLRHVPKAERLLGAPHIYLWGDGFLTRYDIPRPRWRAFCQKLVAEAQSDRPTVGKRVRELVPSANWKQIGEVAALDRPYNQIMAEVTDALSRLLAQPDFFDADAWHDVKLPSEVAGLFAPEQDDRNPSDEHDNPAESATAGRTADVAAVVPHVTVAPSSGVLDTLALPALCRKNGLLLRAAYPEFLGPVETWGDAISLKMIERLQEAGVDRARLCLAGWEGIEKRPEVARMADEVGYLFGTYDSFHSIHDPALSGTDATWSTAQFDPKLYETGAITRWEGTKRSGFKGRGHLLSPHAARPYVETRVRRNMQRVTYSYYFIDCDAYGEVFDDYAPEHPSTQQQDAVARVARLSWIRDTFGVVIGSEGGSSYAAPAVHVIEGLLTPVIGWGDPQMKDRESPYFLGGYYPPDGPQVFIKPVPLKEEYVRLHVDPRFRLPLNEIVFHDSFVSTHHWSAGSLKFTNTREITALIEMLYQCPPLYHLNLDELDKDREWIKRQYDAFSPVHRDIGFAAMTDFAWLTPDRQVQRTVFDDRVEIIANFSGANYAADTLQVAAQSVLVRWLDAKRQYIFTPGTPKQLQGQ